MFEPSLISTRYFIRNYKVVLNRVHRTRQPAVVVNHKKPQVAIVNIKDLQEIQKLKIRQSTRALLDLVGIIPKGSGLPRDLSDKHDKYTWE